MKNVVNLVNHEVIIDSHRGKIRRVVVVDHGEVVEVSRAEEVDLAANEGRKPRVSPFKKADVECIADTD